MPDWSSITVFVSTHIIFRYHLPLKYKSIYIIPNISKINFFPVPKSSTHTSLFCVKNSATNISCLGSFTGTVSWEEYFFTEHTKIIQYFQNMLLTDEILLSLHVSRLWQWKGFQKTAFWCVVRKSLNNIKTIQLTKKCQKSAALA